MTTKLPPSTVKLIEGKNLAFFANLLPNGSPHVTPVWIDHEGDLILVNTAMGRVKQKNTARDKRVSLAIANQEDPYEKVVIFGQVVGQTNQGADEHIDKLARKYTGAKKFQKSSPNEKRVIIKIEPMRVV